MSPFRVALRAPWLLSLLLLLSVAVPPVEASSPRESAVPQPFAASYRLEVRGWPNATVNHRLTREGEHWQSQMRAAIAVARGNERSRFFLDADGVRSVNYASGYSLLGIGGDYRLGGDDLSRLPDRQAALFELSRRALSDDCASDCHLTYQDHKGREEHVTYRVLNPRRLQLPAGDFDAVTVEVTESDHPERRLLLHFHPELPGLLLAAEYHRDGQRRSRMSLTELALLD